MQSGNLTFVFEFAKCLCILAPPKDPAQNRFVVFWDFRETRETREFPSQTRTIRHRHLRIKTFSEFFPFLFLHPPVAHATIYNIEMMKNKHYDNGPIPVIQIRACPYGDAVDTI